jgi:hypothetical protein
MDPALAAVGRAALVRNRRTKSLRGEYSAWCRTKTCATPKRLFLTLDSSRKSLPLSRSGDALGYLALGWCRAFP